MDVNYEYKNMYFIFGWEKFDFEKVGFLKTSDQIFSLPKPNPILKNYLKK